MHRVVLAAVALVACNDSREKPARSSDPPPPPPPRHVLHLIKQQAASDCGDAAIAMTLDYYGKPTPLETIVREMPPEADGLSAAQLLKFAESRGLGGKGVKLENPAHAMLLRSGDIVHVDGNHFVVVDHTADDGIHVFDPAEGEHVIPALDPARQFRVAIVFAETPVALEQRLHGPAR